MERQLVLLDPAPEWKLDDETRAIGRAGLAEARAALRSALRRADGRVDAKKAA
jgi:hypothetical protein